MTRCLGLNFDQVEREHERYPYLEIFDYSVNYVANEEVRCFNYFANRGRRKGTTERSDGDKPNEKRNPQKVDNKEHKKTQKMSRAEKKDAKQRKRTLQKQRGRQILHLDRKNTDTTHDESANHATDKKQTTEKTRKRTVKETKSEEQKRKTKKSVLDNLAERILNDKEAKDPKPKPEESFDISREVELIREIKDIQEELGILSNLLKQQETVVVSFTRIIQEAKAASIAAGVTNALDATVSASSSLSTAIKRRIAYVKEIEGNTDRPYRHLEDLLDLKQKQANVFEARTTRISGNTITVFTIVTIIFLPASFMAAFFALPIEQFPLVGENGDQMELGYAVKYTVIVTVAVAIPFIIFALFVNPIMSIAKLIVKPFVMASIFVYTAAPYMFLILACLATFFWWLLRHIKSIVSSLWYTSIVVLRMLLDWRSIYLWVKNIREAKRKARENSMAFRTRHYVTGIFLRKWHETVQSKREAREHERDVEEQRIDAIAEGGDGDHDDSNRGSHAGNEQEPPGGSSHGDVQRNAENTSTENDLKKKTLTSRLADLPKPSEEQKTDAPK